MIDKNKNDNDINLNNNDDDITIDEHLLFEDEMNIVDIDNTVKKNENFDLIFKLNINKHREEGKHSLNRDTIFKGKINKNVDNYELTNDIIKNDNDENDETNEKFNIVEMFKDDDDYVNRNNLSKDVYNILNVKTDIDFFSNRRKPNKEIFNMYYNLLIKELGLRYTKSELFVELSFYFTDNIFNMFKLLDKKPATIIIKELVQKGFLKNLNGINFL